MSGLNRIVRIKPSRGYGDGLFEVLSQTSNGEVLLKPYKRAGSQVLIFRAHTVPAQVKERMAYLRSLKS
jgi:hypothetical protein